MDKYGKENHINADWCSGMEKESNGAEVPLSRELTRRRATLLDPPATRVVQRPRYAYDPRERLGRYSAVPQEDVEVGSTVPSGHQKHQEGKKWIGRTKAAVCWIAILWFTLFLVLRSGALRPQMSQPNFLRESIIMLDMLLCSRRTIRADMYQPHHTSDKPFNIPFTLYQTWMRQDVSNFRFNDIAMFFKNNPKWTYRLFADDNPNASETVDGWVDEHINTPLNQLQSTGGILEMQMRLGPHFTSVEQHKRIACAYSMLQGGASKADLWRYLIIYRNGGLYADFDAVLSDAYMDGIIGVNDTLVTSVKNEVEVSQYVILAAKHHPILARVVNETTEAILMMGYLHNVANGNSSLFLSLGCNKILSKWKAHAMLPLSADFGARSWNANELRPIINATAYPRRYCTCHNLDHQVPYYAMDKLHAGCLTGPNVWKAAFEWVLYNDDELHGIRIYPSEGFLGRLPAKFLQTDESIWKSNRIEKLKDAGRVTPAWPAMGAHFIDFDNQCWKEFDLSIA